MSEAKQESQEKPVTQGAKPESPKAASPRKGLPGGLVTIAAAVIALGAGTAVGAFLVAPRLVTAQSAGPSEAPSHSSHGQKEGSEKRAIVHQIDNLIVNPAGAEGSHFVMASIVFELFDKKVEEQLRERDFQVRDAVIAVLESQSLEMFAQPGARDSLKSRLAQTVRTLVGPQTRLRVYLPQFVIQ